MNHEMNDEMTAAEKAAQDVEAATQEALNPHLAQFASLDDVGNQMRLVKRFGSTIRYCDSGAWYVYDKTTWSALKTDGPIREKAIEVTHLMQAEIDTIQDDGGVLPAAQVPGAEAPEGADGAEMSAPEVAPPPAKTDGDKPKSEAEVKRAAYAAWRKASRSARKIADMVTMARSHPDILASQNDFDANPWLLAVGNGVLNLKTFKVRPARPEDMLTQQMGVDYDPQATCPTWDAFLLRVQPDSTVREYLRRYVGYCLTGLTSAQIFLFFFGGGQNGKGTFLDTIALLFGDHHSRIRASVIASGSASGGEARFGLAPIVGRRLVTFGEIEQGATVNEALLKELTGQDPVEIETKGRQAYEYQPIAKYILAGNHRPRISGTDVGVWRRVRLVPFDASIPDSERDDTLRDKLQAELPGILNWAIEGLRAYTESGMGTTPEPVLLATKDYKEDSDVLGHFLEGWVRDEGANLTSASTVYLAYMEWCHENGHKAMAINTLSSRLIDRGWVKGTGRGRRSWVGVRLATPEDDLTEDEKAEQKGPRIGQG